MTTTVLVAALLAGAVLLATDAPAGGRLRRAPLRTGQVDEAGASSAAATPSRPGWTPPWRRARVDLGAALAATVIAVAAEVRVGRAPPDAWRFVLGVPVGPDGVPSAADVVAALGTVSSDGGRGAVSRDGGRGTSPPRSARGTLTPHSARGTASHDAPLGPRAHDGGSPDAARHRGAPPGCDARRLHPFSVPRLHAPPPRERARAAVGRVPAGASRHEIAVVRRRVAGVLAAGRLAARLGAPVGGVLDECGRALAADADAETAVRAALAGPTQTTTLLTWLPVLGVVLGTLLGAHPLGMLLDGGVGTASGIGGAALTVLGRRWVRRMVRDARDAGSGLGGG